MVFDIGCSCLIFPIFFNCYKFIIIKVCFIFTTFLLMRWCIFLELPIILISHRIIRFSFDLLTIHKYILPLIILIIHIDPIYFWMIDIFFTNNIIIILSNMYLTNFLKFLINTITLLIFLIDYIRIYDFYIFIFLIEEWSKLFQLFWGVIIIFNDIDIT